MDRFIAVYSRVSSKSQKHASQMPALESYMARAEHPCRLFQDVGSGRNYERKAWQQLWNFVQSEQVYKIVCWKIDRLGRSIVETVRLMTDLRNRNVGLLSLTESFDLESPAGRLMYSLLCSFNEYELEVRRERQESGIAAIREANNGKCTWGGRTKNSRNKDVANKVEAILALHKAKTKPAVIARSLKISRPTVYSVLKTNNVSAS